MRALLLSFFLVVSSAEQEFSYGKDSLGPGQWGCLEKNWTQCRTGLVQSPINVKSGNLFDDCVIGKLSFQFSTSNGTLVSERYVYRIAFEPAAQNFISIEGVRYRLLQFHFHHPGEHLIDGKKFDLEMHLVYAGVDNSSKLAVVSQMFKKGKPSELIEQALELKRTPWKASTIFNLRKLKLGGEYMRYVGSLTTPPCTEGVLWTILLKHKTASKEQIKEMKRYLKGKNARPLQRVNGRHVYAYTFYESYLMSS